MHMTKFLKENFKKYVLTCSLALITSLLKLREFGQYFKNSKKYIFYFVLLSKITNLYVKRIPDIKKVFLLMT
jgi:hypothetical protein